MSEHGQGEHHRRHGLWATLRANFLTGLAVVLPLTITGYMVWTAAGWIDAWVLPWVPEIYQPQHYIGWNIRGYGVVIFLLFTIIVGALTKGLFGRSLVRMAENLVDRMPVVRSLYNATKQIIETVLSQSNNSFEKACLIEYPRKGIWAIGFISTDTRGEIARRADGGRGDMVSVFLPTTPNPTSGFLLFVPRRDVIVLDMSVEDAAKLIISAGLVVPDTAAPAGTAGGEAAPPAPAAPAPGA